MANIFGIQYDVSRDLLYNGVVKPLKILSLLPIIQRCFTHELLIKYSITIYPEVTGPNYKNIKFIFKPIWDHIEREVVELAERVIPVPMHIEIKEVTHFVGTQIFLFLAKNRYPFVTLISILQNLVFTCQGTINLKATIHRVLGLNYLSIAEKFEIACKNFLSHHIFHQYFSDLDIGTIARYLTEIPKRENIPIYFYICRYVSYLKIIDFSELHHVTGEYRVIYFSNDNSLTTIEYLFYWSIYTFNDMAVEYLWEGFISRSRERYKILNVIFSKLIGDFRMANSVIYLLLNILDREMTIFVFPHSAVIFEYILLELRWQSLFSKVFEVLLHIGFEDLSHIFLFKFVISVICFDDQDKFDKCVLKEILIKMPASAKSQIVNECYSFLDQAIGKLYVQNDLETCSLLLTIDDPLDHNSVFITSSEGTLFDSLLFSGKSVIIDHILMNSLHSSTAILDLNAMFSRRANPICQFLISFQRWISLSWFINWCLSFELEENIKPLKVCVLVMEDGKLLKKLIFQDRETDEPFLFVDKVLKWGCGSQKYITRIKNCIKMAKETDDNENSSGYREINIYTEIKECVIKLQFEFLRCLFKWKPFSREEIRELKNCLKSEREFYQIIFREKKTLNFFSLFIGLL